MTIQRTPFQLRFNTGKLLGLVCTGAPKIVPDDLPTLHDKFHALQFGDIVRGVAGDANEIRKLALLDRPDSVLPANVLCGHRGCGTNGLEGGMPYSTMFANSTASSPW